MKRIAINLFLVLAVVLAGVITVSLAVAQDEPGIAKKELLQSEKVTLEKGLLEKWQNLSPQERERLRERHKILKNMTSQQRKALRENLEKFKQLPPEKQEMIIEHWQRVKNLPPEERKAIFKNYRKWQNLSPKEREILRQRYRDLHQLNPQERQRFLERQKRWQSLSPQQKENLRRQHQRMRRDIQGRRNIHPAPARRSGVQRKHPTRMGPGNSRKR